MYAQEKVKQHETAGKLSADAVSRGIKKTYDGINILPHTLQAQVSKGKIGVSPP